VQRHGARWGGRLHPGDGPVRDRALERHRQADRAGIQRQVVQPGVSASTRVRPGTLPGGMEVETVGRRTERPVALDARTACEAFQTTAAAHPDRVAIRTKGDEFQCTWGEYASRVEALAGGLAALGVRGGDTVALMLA